MKYLVDTHIFLWAIISPEKLSEKVQTILLDSNNTIIVSSITLWEISLKYGSGKLLLGKIQPEDLITISKKMGFTFLELSIQDAGTFHLLAGEYHKDSFDRILIWQAISNNYVFISDDKAVIQYRSNGLKVIS